MSSSRTIIISEIKQESDNRQFKDSQDSDSIMFL